MDAARPEHLALLCVDNYGGQLPDRGKDQNVHWMVFADENPKGHATRNDRHGDHSLLPAGGIPTDHFLPVGRLTTWHPGVVELAFGVGFMQ